MEIRDCAWLVRGVYDVIQVWCVQPRFRLRGAEQRSGLGESRAGQGSETAELTRAGPSTVKLLRRLSYAAWTMVTVLHLILRRRHGILIRILPVFQSISFIVPSATFGFVLFYQLICRNHLTSNHQPSEGPWFMTPLWSCRPHPPLLTWKSFLHHCTARTENIKTFAPKMRGRTLCYLYLQYANLALCAWRDTFRNVRCLFLKAVVAYLADRELTEGKITTLRTCTRLE